MEVRTPFPGDYIIEQLDPLEVNLGSEHDTIGEMSVKIPPATEEPWHVHTPEFDEEIIVSRGTLVLQILDGDELRKEIYGEGERVKVGFYIPHKLCNYSLDTLELLVYYTPVPWEEELEPEFRSLDDAKAFCFVDRLKVGFSSLGRVHTKKIKIE